MKEVAECFRPGDDPESKKPNLQLNRSIDKGRGRSMKGVHGTGKELKKDLANGRAVFGVAVFLLMRRKG